MIVNKPIFTWNIISCTSPCMALADTSRIVVDRNHIPWTPVSQHGPLTCAILKTFIHLLKVVNFSKLLAFYK
jgi:hypothetical protein